MLDSIARAKNGFQVLALSIKFMLKNKICFLFALLNTLFVVAVSGLALYISFFLLHIPFSYIQTIKTTIALAIILLVIYFIISIINTFFAVSTSFFTLNILQQKRISLNLCINHALSKLKIIVAWSISFAYLGYILSALTEKKEGLAENQKKNVKILPAIEKIIEFAWPLTVFFVPPIIAFEDIHLTTLLKHSMGLMKDTFGQSIIMQFSFKLISFIIILLSTILFLICLYLIHTGKTTLGINLIIALFICTVFIFSIINIAKAVFKASIYSYAKRLPTGVFSSQFIHKNFTTTKQA